MYVRNLSNNWHYASIHAWWSHGQVFYCKPRVSGMESFLDHSIFTSSFNLELTCKLCEQTTERACGLDTVFNCASTFHRLTTGVTEGRAVRPLINTMLFVLKHFLDAPICFTLHIYSKFTYVMLCSCGTVHRLVCCRSPPPNRKGECPREK